jgi:peptidylprolyl isomerase
MMKSIAIMSIVAMAATLATAQSATPKKVASTSGPIKVTRPGVKTGDGLQYWDIRVGNGQTAKEGSHVRVHYTGWFTSGKKFDSSLDAGKPFDFTIGDGQVIQGWEEGVTGMRVGGKRQLLIPPSLAYGSQGTPDGPIPPNATLIFDIQLLGVE